MAKLPKWTAIAWVALIPLCASSAVRAGPIDVALDPVPQSFTDTCQSYSMALAMSFDPASPVHANTVVELRDLERQVRAKLLTSAHGAEPVRKDWKAAVEAVTGGALTVKWKSFTSLDSAMRFTADKTGVSAPQTLGTALSVALVKTPVMLSFRRVASSSYASTHIVTVFGVSLPPATMSDSAHPGILLVNSAIKYAGGIKNICASSDLSDSDRYRAAAMLTSDYDMTNFGAPAPFLVTWIEAANP